MLRPPLEGLLGALGRVCDRVLLELDGLAPDDQEFVFREEDEDQLDWPEPEDDRDVERAAGEVEGAGRFSSQESSMVSAASDTVRQNTLGCTAPDVTLEASAPILLVSKRPPPVALLMDDEAQIGVLGATTIGVPPGFTPAEPSGALVDVVPAAPAVVESIVEPVRIGGVRVVTEA